MPERRRSRRRFIRRRSELADRLPLSARPTRRAASPSRHVFWQSAQSKLASWPVTLQLFALEYRLPVLDPGSRRPLATAAELTGAMLLVLRPVLASRGADAARRRRDDPDLRLSRATGASICCGRRSLLLIFARGAGVISLDHLAGRLFSRER